MFASARLRQEPGEVEATHFLGLRPLHVGIAISRTVATPVQCPTQRGGQRLDRPAAGAAGPPATVAPAATFGLAAKVARLVHEPLRRLVRLWVGWFCWAD